MGAPPSGCCRRMARTSRDWAEDSSGCSRGETAPADGCRLALHGRPFATHWCTRQGWAGVGGLTNAMSSLWPAGPTGVPVEELPGAATPFDGKSGGKMTLAVCVWGRLLVEDATLTPVQGVGNPRKLVRAGGPRCKADVPSRTDRDGHDWQSHRWRRLVARGAMQPREGPWLKQGIWGCEAEPAGGGGTPEVLTLGARDTTHQPCQAAPRGHQKPRLLQPKLRCFPSHPNRAYTGNFPSCNLGIAYKRAHQTDAP